MDTSGRLPPCECTEKKKDDCECEYRVYYFLYLFISNLDTVRTYLYNIYFYKL